jgi:hypothetical protein
MLLQPNLRLKLWEMIQMGRKFRLPAPIGTRFCPRCEQNKPLSEFRGGYCTSCTANYQAGSGAKYVQKSEMALREQAIAKYGGKCFNCGEKEVQVLTLVPSFGTGLTKMARELRKAGWPVMDAAGIPIQVVCANCRMKR